MEGPCYLPPHVCVFGCFHFCSKYFIKDKTIHTQPLCHNSLTHPATKWGCTYLVLLLLHFTGLHLVLQMAN